MAQCTIHPRVAHEINVHHGAEDRGVGWREDDLDDEEARFAFDEAGKDVLEDDAAGLVGPVVEYVTEEVGSCSWERNVVNNLEWQAA